MNINMVRYPNRLRELREAADLSQAAAARALAMSQSTLNRHEQGNRDIDAVAIERYARFYQVANYELFVPSDHELEYSTDEA